MAAAIALPVAVLVLLLVFQTVVAAILPVAVGPLAVLGGIAIVMLLSHVVDVASYTIREAYLHGADNTRAIAAGLAHSASLITAAAAIMVTVFAAFALAHFVVIRSVGFGMALAVTLDATIVRLLLVPSSMQLLGHWNWRSPHLHRRRRLHAPG